MSDEALTGGALGGEAPIDDAEHEHLLDGVNPRQERAIAALLNEPTVARAAQAVGIGERTLHRWIEEPRFANAYRRARRRAFGQAVALTQRYAVVAVQSLARIITDQSASHGARVSAASALLRFGREGIELDDLCARVEALEAASAADPIPISRGAA